MMNTQDRWIFWTLGVLVLSMHSLCGVANAATVYQCMVGGQRVFSDQPCARDAVTLEVAEPNRMAAPAPDASAVHRKPVPAAHNSSGKANEDDRAQRTAACNKLRAQQRAIQEQMRAGYSAAKGERLRQRAQSLAAAYASQRCERYR